MKDILKLTLGRVAGALVGAVCGFAAGKGLGTISPESAAEITAVLTNGVMLAGYGVAHKVFDKKRR